MYLARNSEVSHAICSPNPPPTLLEIYLQKNVPRTGAEVHHDLSAPWALHENSSQRVTENAEECPDRAPARLFEAVVHDALGYTCQRPDHGVHLDDGER